MIEEQVEQIPTPLARLLSLPARIWSRVIEPVGLRLVAPTLALLLTYALWRAWIAAGASALGRAVRWHAVFVTTAALSGALLYLLIAPPDDPSDERVGRALASEGWGRPVHTAPVAAAGALVVAVSALAALRVTWCARVPAAERAAAVTEWRSLRARHAPRVLRVGAAALAAIGGLAASVIALAGAGPSGIPRDAPTEGALWVGTPLGAAQVTTRGWEPVRRPWAPLPSAEVTDLATGPDGEVWIATTGGLLRRDPRGAFLRVVVENAPLPYPTVLGVAVDRRGVAWAATVSGAAGVDPTRNGRAFNGRTAPLMHNLLDACFVDRAGRVWFGGVGGVNVYEPPADWSQPGHWPAGFNRWSTNGGLPDNLIFAIFEDSKGRVWFGTEDGAAALTVDPAEYALGASEPSRWQTFGVRNSGLAHDKVHAIAEDRRGRIYFATEQGVSMYDEMQPEARRWSTIDPSRLPDAYVEALLAAPDGRLWIGTKRGLTVYDPDRDTGAGGLPVYRSNPLRRWTGLFWGPHARLDAPGDRVNALAWAPPPR